ncbi:MAG TPA: biotin--[acetyl-CoA-carboxylase] ligase [Candidatus Edwardsbacteria bacterium]|nr:biotin--[acetyl-CoA-carboxylase] ligase [Candidatus Edwardsbacteria bacterium]
MQFLQIDYIKENLHTTSVGRKLTYFERLPSTSEQLKALARDRAADGAVIIAEQQTAGHGRQGHLWYSPPGTGLYFSVLLRPDLPLLKLSGLTLALGHAAATAIEQATGLAVQIKWPNDLYCNVRKCGGILAEVQGQDGGPAHVVVGIGINVNNDFLPLELCESATSLRLESGRPVFREGLLVALLTAVERDYAAFLAGGLDGFATALQQRSYLAGRWVRVQPEDGSAAAGVVTGIDNNGALLLISEKGETMRVSSGTVLEVKE